MELKHIHFIVFTFVYVFYGAVVTGVGPIILFFSEVTGEDETSFAYIFMARALGYLVGGQLIKVLTKRFKYYSIFVVLIVICSVALIVSSLSISFWNLSITMFIAASGCIMLNILCNLCIFELFAGDNQDYWIQLINLFFGVGGLIGPFIVIEFREAAMKTIGILFLFTLIPFYFLRSPETHQDVTKY